MAAMVEEPLATGTDLNHHTAGLDINGSNRANESNEIHDESSDVVVIPETPGRPLFDLSLINGGNTGDSNNPRSRGGGSTSVATTADLASDVGSVMMAPREAFMKSFTFYPQQEEIKWGISLGEPMATKKGFLLTKTRIPVASIEETSIFNLSRIRQGDYLKTINGKTVGPSFTPDRAISKMKDTLERDGYLCVTTKNKEEGSDDILVHATIIKPSPEMTLAELGMTVWIWGYLCIKSFKRDSIFKRTALKETDHIVSVNEIVCQNVTPEGFASIIRQLPNEITITVLRRRQRSSGNFN